MADAGRVIAGTARGIRLTGPGGGTRPMGDRVKQTLFAILEPDLREAAFLDLFAGSGAAGIEALSRGAASATFVERDGAAIKVIGANLDRARLGGPAARLVNEEAVRWLGSPRRVAEGPWDVAIADPPYDRPELLVAALTALGPHLVPGGRAVAKHASQVSPPARIGLLASERERRFGETTLTFYRRVEDR
jgi:16S rRNA (guanine(966)-N(2))-methyltransferase RsmD